MAITTLNTKIKLRYDTFANWTSNNPILLKGEVAVVEVAQNVNATQPQGSTNPSTVNENSYKPTILFKVGIAPAGTENTSANQELYGFNTLPWASALAADVYAWAKKAQAETGDNMLVTGLSATPGEGHINISNKNGTTLNSVIQTIFDNFNELTGGNGSINEQVNAGLANLVNTATNASSGTVSVTDSTENYITGLTISTDGNGVKRLTLTEGTLPTVAAPSADATAVTPGGNTTVDVITDISQTKGAISATKKTLSFGDAAQKDVFSGTLGVSTNSADLPTAAQVATFVKDSIADLEGATHFRGVVNAAPSASVTDGPLDTPATYTVGEAPDTTTVNYAPGDIIIYSNKEYIMDASNHWIELGDESAYVLKEENKRLMTADEGTKLAGIEAGAEVNTIADVKISSTDGTTSASATITNKTITLGALAGKNVVAAGDLAQALAQDIDGKLDDVDASIATINGNVVTIKGGLTVDSTTTAGTNTVVNTTGNDIELAAIAKTGSVYDLVQASGALILDGGNAAGTFGA